MFFCKKDGGTMTNIETEKTLDDLSGLCCDALTGDSRGLNERSRAMLKNLLECGFATNYRQPLQVEIENRVLKQWPEPIFVHRDELQSLVSRLQREFDDLKRWEVRIPQEIEPPDAANLNTAGHAIKRRDLHQ